MFLRAASATAADRVKSFRFTAGFQCPRLTAWSPSKIQDGPSKCVNVRWHATGNKHAEERFCSSVARG